MLLMLEMANGVLVDVEAAVNIAVRLRHPRRGRRRDRHGRARRERPVVVKRKGGSTAAGCPSDWRERFIRAYDTEFQEWIDAVAAGDSTGPSSWDGYAATVVVRRRAARHGDGRAGDRVDARAAGPVPGQRQAPAPERTEG